jgi:hypothetical protein
MEPQWGTYLFIEKPFREEELTEAEDFEYDKSKKLFKLKKEQDFSYTNPDGENIDATRIKTIPFDIKNEGVIVYSGSKKARYLKNQLNKSTEGSLKQVKINLRDYYGTISEDFVLDPQGVTVNGFEVDEFVVGKLQASVERKKSFKELLDKEVEEISFELGGSSFENRIKVKNNSQIRIHGKNPKNREIMEKMFTKMRSMLQ